MYWKPQKKNVILPRLQPDVDGCVEDADDGEGEEVVGHARHDGVVASCLRQQVDLAVEVVLQHVWEVPQAWANI